MQSQPKDGDYLCINHCKISNYRKYFHPWLQNKQKKIEIERAKRDQMVVHVVESSSCDIYRLVWITIITPPLHTFFTQKQKQKSDFFDGFVEESEKEYVNHHEASNTEMLVRLGRQLISSSSHCLCSYKK